MKLFGLYLKEGLGLNQDVPDPVQVDDRKEADVVKVKGEVEKLTFELRNSLERLVKSLEGLPVLDTDTEAKQGLEQVMGSIANLRDSFDEGGRYFNTILSAITAGGKA